MRTVRIEAPSGRLVYAIKMESADSGLTDAMLRDVERTAAQLDAVAEHIHETRTPRAATLAFAYVLVDRAALALFDGGTVETFVSAMLGAKRIARVIRQEVRQPS